MREKSYDQAALIEAYIAAQRDDYVHEDFVVYYKGLLAALEQAFGLSLSGRGGYRPGMGALRLLFQSSVRSYLAIRTTRSGFLDDSLLNVKLEQLGAEGASIQATEMQIAQLAQHSRELHLQLLSALFDQLYGPLDRIVTSAELRALGFDDAKEPDISDYWDYA